jgi:ABC-type amino acid transport substrate-binding protein
MNFWLCFAAFFVSLASHAEVRELNVALGAQTPAMLQSTIDPNKGATQSGGLTGFNEMLAREICRRAAARCKFSNQTYADILPSIESGKFDLGFGNFLRTPEREKRVAFSDTIWRSSSRLLAKPAVISRTAIELKREVTLDSLSGVRVGVVEGTLQHSYLRSIAAERHLEVLSFVTMAELITALRDDRVDFLLMPVLSSYALISREPAGTFEYVGPPVADRGLGGSVHIAITRQKPEVLPAVNLAIAAMRADGTYQRIVRQFFPFSLD